MSRTADGPRYQASTEHAGYWHDAVVVDTTLSWPNGTIVIIAECGDAADAERIATLLNRDAGNEPVPAPTAAELVHQALRNEPAAAKLTDEGEI